MSSLTQTTPVAQSLLIIDDDTELTEMLQSYLQTSGYQVQVASDGIAGLKIARADSNIDLILLDVMMPGMDGFDVLKALRQTHITPVLMLTARGDDYDRILGLELGADDYLPKPFNHRELVARIKALFRRQALTSGARQQQDVSHNQVTLSVSRQIVTCHGEQISLTGTEFGILHLLLMNAGSLVTKEDISDKVLGKPLQAYDRSIDMHVSNLRKKLAAAGDEEKIKTIRGSGYLFMLAS